MKRWIIKLHLWFGLTIGLLWALQGLTGAALVFHRELDRLANPERVGSAGPMRSLDEVIAAAETYAGADVGVIRLVYRRPDILGADFTGADGKARTLFLDAATAEVVDVRFAMPPTPVAGSTSRFIYNIHDRLVAGKTGEILIGASGVFLLTSVLIGLWIGWPRKRAWKAVTAVGNWRSLPQKLYGWHRLGGVGLGIVAALIATSGVYLAFSEPIRLGLAHGMMFEPQPRDQLVVRVSADTALQIARARFPGSVFVRLAWPTAKAPVYTVRLLQPGEPRTFLGRTTVTVDAETGRVLHSYDAAGTSFGNRLIDALFAIHNGEIAGPVGRVVAMLAGLSLPLLYVTGTWLWLFKRRKRAGRGVR